MRIFLLLLLLLASCKKDQTHSGGGGGSVPTAEDLNDYIDRLTTPKDSTCGDVITDRQTPRKYPIIYPSGKKTWKDEYSSAIAEQFDKDFMRPLKMQKIDEGDLSLLGCKGYNYATDEEKKQFWILFLSAVSKPESNFNPMEEYKETDGTTSTGMLQIDPAASNRWCGILSKDMKKSNFGMSDMRNPTTNLKCGLLMMQWQILGVPKGSNMQQTRPDLKGRLFTDNTYWYWSTLSNKNSSGKREVIDWFRVHAQRQLKFCNRTNPIDGYTPGLSSKYKEMNCNEVANSTERANCEKYLLNIKLEEKTFEPKLGENPVEDSCKIINNSARNISKETTEDGNPEEETESNGKSK